MEALGLIEVVGLTAGVEAADVACKTANVELVGYELAKGGGYVTIKVIGKVGAVNAAVDAAAQAAARITRVVSKLVIARPSDQLEPMVRSASTVGYTPEPVVPAEPVAAPTKPAEAETAAAPTKPAEAEAAAEPAKAPAKATATPAKTPSGRK